MPAAGIAAASGGNHGAAVAYAAMRLGHKARIFVPEISSPAKIARIRGYGADLTVGGKVYAEALAACEAYIAETGALSVHAFDQVETMLGQGSVGLELERQAPDIDTLLVAVGGGGLIGGIAAWYEGRIKIVGVEPRLAPTLSMALAAGRPVDAPAGGIAADSLAPKRIGELVFPIVRRHGVRAVLVEDEAILDAQRALWETARIAAEPGAAAPLAALLSGAYVAGARTSASASSSPAAIRRRWRSIRYASFTGKVGVRGATSPTRRVPAPHPTSPHAKRHGERERHAALTLCAASSQPLIFSMSGGSPLRSRRWPSLEAAKARTSAHSLSASAAAIASRRAIAGAHQQLRVRAPQARHRADEPRLVLPVGDGLGRDVARVHQHRQRRRLGPHQVPDAS